MLSVAHLQSENNSTCRWTNHNLGTQMAPVALAAGAPVHHTDCNSTDKCCFHSHMALLSHDMACSIRKPTCRMQPQAAVDTCHAAHCRTLNPKITSVLAVTPNFSCDYQ